MSGALTGLATAVTLAAPAAPFLGPVYGWIRNPRSIGTIIPDITIEENHSDRVQLTQHPVAFGTPVSDHAFMQPMSLTMRLGWTNANLVGSITSGAISGFASGGIGGALAGGGTGALSSFTETRVKEVYKTMLDLQKKFEPMTIVTGKRTYENMLLIDISTKTDHTTEYSMIMECHFQEVIRVNTRTTTQPTISNQEMPDKTGQTTGAGTRQTGPGRTILRDMSGRPGYIKGQGLQASGGVGA